MSSKKKKTIVQKNSSNKIEGNISQKMQKGTVIASKQELYSGPLPPASELIKYSEAVENGAERIFNMVEGQYKHRQNLENKIIDSDIKSRNRGQFLAFIIGMTTIIGGFALILLGKDVTGLISLIASLSTLLAAYFRGTQRQKEEIKNKEE